MTDFKKMAEEYGIECRKLGMSMPSRATAYLAGVTAGLEAAGKRVAPESDYFASLIRALKPQP